jgi:O-antigen/teichoic acid export membrane protein
MTVRKAATAGVWSTLEVLLRQGVQFGITIVLARILTPSDFGIIGLLTFFSSLATVFIQGGLTTALVQRQQTSLDQESAFFWINLAAAVVLGVILVGIGPLLAEFYEQPLLAPLMIAACLQIIFSALGAVQTALLTRALDFRSLMHAGVVSTLIAGAMAVAAAWLGSGVWALAIQLAAAAAMNSLMLWFLSGWRPNFHFRPSTLSDLFAFGGWISLSSFLEVIYSQGFALLVGKLHGLHDLGLYNRAVSTQLLPSNVLATVIAKVALPLFSSRSDDKEGTRRGLKLAIGLAMLLNVPAMVGLAVLSDLVIIVLFGEQWAPAAPLLSILAISGIIFPMHVLNLQALLGRGNSRSFFKLEIAKKLIGVPCVVIGSFFGIYGLAYLQIVANFLALALNANPNKHALDLGLTSQLSGLWDIALATALMAGGILLLRPMIDLGQAETLGVLTLAGAGIYFAIGLVLKLPSFKAGLGVAQQMIHREPVSAE